MSRPVNRIAAEITNIFLRLKRDRKGGSFLIHSWPYLEALLEMDSFSGLYGLEERSMIGWRFLDNVAMWRGDDARRLKAEIRTLLEEHDAHRIR